MKVEEPEQRQLTCKFQDREGLEWNTEVTFDAVIRVKDELGVDLLEVSTNPEILGGILSNTYQLFGIAVVILRPQMVANNISEEDFGRRLAGEKILEMRDAIGDGIVYFFSGPERHLLDRMMRAAREGEAQQRVKITQAIASPEMDREIEKALADLDNEVTETIQRATGSGSGSGQAPSA